MTRTKQKKRRGRHMDDKTRAKVAAKKAAKKAAFLLEEEKGRCGGADMVEPFVEGDPEEKAGRKDNGDDVVAVPKAGTSKGNAGTERKSLRHCDVCNFHMWTKAEVKKHFRHTENLKKLHNAEDNKGELSCPDPEIAGNGTGDTKITT